MRTYKTLSLSLPPGIVEELAMIGKPTGRVAARVATEIVLREIARTTRRTDQQRSWCCQTRVTAVKTQLVLPETGDGKRNWMPVVVLLCADCGRQMHGREYEGWIACA